MKQVFENADKKMNKTINALTSEFAGIRAGRANPAVLDKIMVDYYGSPTAINPDHLSLGPICGARGGKGYPVL